MAIYPNPSNPMNKQFLLSVVVLFVLSLGFGYVVHACILKQDYLQLPNLMRTEADGARHFPAMLVAHVFIALGITAIYRRGREPGRSWTGQGIRFGIQLAVISPIPVYLMYYAVQPMPLSLVEKQIGLDTVVMVILGLAAAGLNKQPT